MSNEYPVMLYKDNLSNYVIANDDDEYSKYIAKGYTTHDDVKDEPVPEVTESNESIDTVDELKVQITELKQQLAVYESARDANAEGIVSYDEMTSAELQALLKQRGVEFKTRDSKDVLVKLANDSE